MKPHRTIPPRFNEPTAGASSENAVNDGTSGDEVRDKNAVNGGVESDQAASESDSPVDAASDEVAAAKDYKTWCGRRIADRFLLEQFVGTGTFGAVFRGTDQRFPGRVVAVKIGVGVVKHDHFFREARLLGQLNSEFVVSVYEYGEDDGVPYIVMEFLHGRTLADLSKAADGQLSQEMISQCVEEVGRALASMHAVNLIHRDLKPDNIMLVDAADSLSHDGRRQRFKIIDFGISSKIDAADSQRNATFDGAGTPQYMAPEQFQSESVTARTDIYAFGVLLFALHSGRVPFQAKTPTVSGLAELVNTVLNTTAPTLSQIVSADRVVTAGLDTLIAECLAKRPEDRPESIAEVCRRYQESITPADETSAAGSQRQKVSGITHRKQNLRMVGTLGLLMVVAGAAMFASGYFEPRLSEPGGSTLVATPDTRLKANQIIEEFGAEETGTAESPLSAAPDVPTENIPLPENAPAKEESEPGTEPAKGNSEPTKEPKDQTEKDGSKPTTEVAGAPNTRNDSPVPIEPEAPQKVEPVVPQQPSPTVWTPAGFTPGQTSQVIGDVSLWASLRLADPEMTFLLIVPKDPSPRGVAKGAPTKAFYISESLVSRGVFASVSGATSKAPAATQDEATVTNNDDSAQIDLNDVDVGDLLNLLDAKEKEDREKAPSAASLDTAADPSPMTNLTWFGADRFCLLLTAEIRSRSPAEQREQLRFRLPTHPQWWAAAGYFSEPHGADDVVRNPAASGLKQIGYSGFEWTRSAVDGRILNTNSVSDLAEISLDTQIRTPGSADRRLTFGMFDADDRHPAGRPSGKDTAFRIVLEVPELEKSP